MSLLTKNTSPRLHAVDTSGRDQTPDRLSFFTWGFTRGKNRGQKLSPLSANRAVGLRERKLHRLAAGWFVAAGAAGAGGFVAAFRRRAYLTHGTLRRAANAFHAALHAVTVLLIGIARRAGQIIGAVGKVIAGLFAAHWREQHSEADTQPQPDQETFHYGPPNIDVCCSTGPDKMGVQSTPVGCA